MWNHVLSFKASVDKEQAEKQKKITKGAHSTTSAEITQLKVKLYMAMLYFTIPFDSSYLDLIYYLFSSHHQSNGPNIGQCTDIDGNAEWN